MWHAASLAAHYACEANALQAREAKHLTRQQVSRLAGTSALATKAPGMGVQPGVSEQL